MSWVEDIAQLYSEDEESLEHYGKAHDDNPPGRGSGRYGWGSGERIFQRDYDIYARYQKLRKSGMSDVEIAKALGYYKTYPDGRPILIDGEPQGNTSLLRARMQISRTRVRQENREIALTLRETIDPDTGKLYTDTKIAELLKLSGESYVRQLCDNESAASNSKKTEDAANKLKELVDKDGYINVTKGNNLALDISQDRMKVALTMLQEEGYQLQTIYVPQVGAQNGQMTTMVILCPKDAQPGDASRNRDKIRNVEEIDGTSSEFVLRGIQDPARVDVNRVKVLYDEDGGTLRDGMIEIRAIRGEDGKLYPACEDLSLGNAKYAQVRIAVDTSEVLANGDRYIKGMAVYNDHLPDGVDILVNSNKSREEGLDAALKKMNQLKDKDGNVIGVDTENPFGATVWQSEYAKGKLSAINIVGDTSGADKHVEGAWNEWSRNLASQFLGKQSEALIKQQLDLKESEMREEFEQIKSMTNPVVKKQMLIDFAESCDAAATDLKAAPLPGQRVQVILPLKSIKPSEVYAPNYEDGQTLALVRFPHTGPFETPIVKVNNKNKEALGFMKDAKDAIGINAQTAQALSGADFDGDTVVCIPMTRKTSDGMFTKTVNIKGIGNGAVRLPGMENFNPSKEYPAVPGMKVMDSRTKGIEMGVVSNLITDMSIKGCDDPEKLARAVKYSMVVIDAEKHKLNYKQAEKDYNIKALKEEYQSNKDGTHGTSTLLSRAGSETQVDQRQIWTPSAQSIDSRTGEKIYKTSPHAQYPEEVKVKELSPTGTWTDPKTGKVHKSKYLKDDEGKEVYKKNPETGKDIYVKTGNMKTRQQSVSKMSTVKDARELMSDNPSNKEVLYANFANSMKALANNSRKEWLSVETPKRDPEAAKKYANEVSSLEKKLNDAKKNKPREQQAQLVANQIVSARLSDNPGASKEEKKKIKGQALRQARAATGAQKQRVTFSDKEWEAIQHNALSSSKVGELLKNADKEEYTKRALPRTSRISDSTAQRINSLLNAGWTRNQIVDAGYASMDTIEKVQAGNY